MSVPRQKHHKVYGVANSPFSADNGLKAGSVSEPASFSEKQPDDVASLREINLNPRSFNSSF
jgi:hypothetical protein